MKLFQVIPFVAVAAFSSCDHIDAVGDKVNDLKDLRKESTQGIDGMKLDQILDDVKGGPAIQDIAQTEFQTFVAEPGRLNIVDFHADWCPPCKKLGPILAQVVEANSNVCRLGKINVDQAKELARSQGVRGIPDVRFYLNGKLVHHFVGGESKATLEKLIAEHTSSIIPMDDLAGHLDAGLDGVVGGESSLAPKGQVKAEVNPIDEAMQPMKKDWLPPGMSPKK